MRSPQRMPIAMLLVAVLAGKGRAQGVPSVDPGKAATIRHLLDLTGAARLALNGMEATVPAQRAANPAIPPAFWDAFMVHARRELNELVDSMVPIYAAHFSQEELEQLVRFYESPLGKRLSEAQPYIMQESMQAGQRWGMKIGKAIGDSMARSRAGSQNPNQ